MNCSDHGCERILILDSVIQAEVWLLENFLRTGSYQLRFMIVLTRHIYSMSRGESLEYRMLSHHIWSAILNHHIHPLSIFNDNIYNTDFMLEYIYYCLMNKVNPWLILLYFWLTIQKLNIVTTHSRISFRTSFKIISRFKVAPTWIGAFGIGIATSMTWSTKFNWGFGSSRIPWASFISFEIDRFNTILQGQIDSFQIFLRFSITFLRSPHWLTSPLPFLFFRFVLSILNWF